MKRFFCLLPAQLAIVFVLLTLILIWGYLELSVPEDQDMYTETWGEVIEHIDKEKYHSDHGLGYWVPTCEVLISYTDQHGEKIQLSSLSDNDCFHFPLGKQIKIRHQKQDTAIAHIAPEFDKWLAGWFILSWYLLAGICCELLQRCHPQPDTSPE